MISYQPALDRFHTVFRMACLLEGLPAFLPVEVEKLRILDFYMAFPFRLESFTFRQDHTALKKVGAAYLYAQPYGGMPDDTALFLRMMPVQALALDTLAAHEILEPDQYKQGIIAPGNEDVPTEIADRAVAFVAEHGDLIDALRKLASDYPLLGTDGLKRRSGLMEFKYDAV